VVARFSVELPHHQAPLIDRGDDGIPNQVQSRAADMIPKMLENYLFKDDVKDVELGGLGAGENSFLAMAAQMDISAQIVRIAQMGDEADQRICHAIIATKLNSRNRTLDRAAPLFDNLVEISLNNVRCLSANR